MKADITAEDISKALDELGFNLEDSKPDPWSQRLREQFEAAKAAGLHAYEMRLKGIGRCAGGTSTAYVSARTPEEARAKVAAEHDPAEEEIGEVSLQTLKFAAPVRGQCPCVLCSDS